MAISTAGVYLMYRTHDAANTTAYSKMVDITEFPDMWSAPDTIDVTTMSDGQSLSIPDIIKLNNLEFSAFYEKNAQATGTKAHISHAALVALDGQHLDYALCFGSTTGSDGALLWEGKQSAGVKGGSVSSAVEVGISIYPSTSVTYSKNGIVLSSSNG